MPSMLCSQLKYLKTRVQTPRWYFAFFAPERNQIGIASTSVTVALWEVLFLTHSSRGDLVLLFISDWCGIRLGLWKETKNCKMPFLIYPDYFWRNVLNGSTLRVFQRNFLHPIKQTFSWSIFDVLLWFLLVYLRGIVKWHLNFPDLFLMCFCDFCWFISEGLWNDTWRENAPDCSSIFKKFFLVSNERPSPQCSEYFNISLDSHYAYRISETLS